MKLATVPNGRADGELVIVSRDHKRMLRAGAVAPTLQAAIDRWAELHPALETLYHQLCESTRSGQEFDAAQALPLPRAYQWCDGSVYKAHNERMSKWINRPIYFRRHRPESHWNGNLRRLAAPAVRATRRTGARKCQRPIPSGLYGQLHQKELRAVAKTDALPLIRLGKKLEDTSHGQTESSE
jgi:hypothetical protein